MGNPKEVKALQRKLKAVVNEGISLVDVVHVTLYRQILPLLVWAIPMCEFKLEDDAVVQEFFQGEDLGGMWKLLSKPRKNCFPSRAEDISLSQAIPVGEVT